LPRCAGANMSLALVFEGFLCLIVIGLSGWLLTMLAEDAYIAIDSRRRPRIRAKGSVVTKRHRPARSVVMNVCNAALGSALPHLTRHPEDRTLEVTVEGKVGSLNVEQALYQSIAVGDLVEVEYVIGRWTGNLYIQQVSLLAAEKG
jgi:hypothetical protein